jgi:hypothetical protein
MSKPESQADNKPYSKPTFTIYGSIRELTKSVNNMGGSDNGTPPRHKTGFK